MYKKFQSLTITTHLTTLAVVQQLTGHHGHEVMGRGRDEGAEGCQLCQALPHQHGTLQTK